MISKQDLEKILQKLVVSTNEGKLNWIATDTNEYRCSFPRSSVVSSKNGSRYYLRVINDEGDEVGVISAISEGLQAAEAGLRLKELYALAERNALSIDDTLQDIWNSLM